MSTITFEPDGSARFIWDDCLQPIASELGRLNTQRASHVEFDNERQGWVADLDPVCGPKLGPFAQRKDALAAEREWLDRNWQ